MFKAIVRSLGEKKSQTGQELVTDWSYRLGSHKLGSLYYNLPGAYIGDTTERLLSLVSPTDYHPLLLFHAESNGTALRKLSSIDSAYMSLWGILKGSGAQVVFSSFLSVRWRGSWSSKWIKQVNAWPHGWCHT